MIIAGCILAALAIGAFIYLMGKLTVSFLKKYRTKKYTKIFVASVGDIIKKAPIMNIDDLPNENDVIIVEYDEEADELVQDMRVSNDIDEKVKNILNENGGIVIFE